MTLVNVERIKLFTTRSPYWCLGLILVVAAGFALIFGLVEQGREATVFLSQTGLQLGQSIFMVLAVLAVTTEYRFGTLRSTFLAVPQRGKVLLAKTVLVVVLGAVAALVAAFLAFFLTKALATFPDQPLALETGDDWRVVAGNAAIFAISGIIAVAIGTLVRQSAGGIAIVLLWPLLVESLIAIIPNIGSDIQPWMPFRAGTRFVTSSEGGGMFGLSPDGPTPVQGLLVFLGTGVVLWVISLIVLNRRDA
jgi:ABC-2 type transport system permease protein